jgi:hypothetical protein
VKGPADCISSGAKIFSFRNASSGRPETFSNMAAAITKLVLLYCQRVPGSKFSGFRAQPSRIWRGVTGFNQSGMM